MFKNFWQSFSIKNYGRDLAWNFGAAALYFFAGKLGLLLALSPGYVTVIWPPAGITLAILLLYGYRLLPGIWLGAFILNLSVYLSDPGIYSLEFYLVKAITLGCSATLQGFAGAFLIARCQCLPTTLERFRDIGALILYGALSCLINATLGVTLLLINHTITSDHYCFTWLMWWSSNTISVLIFTPAILLLLQPKTEISTQRKIFVALPLTVIFRGWPR